MRLVYFTRGTGKLSKSLPSDAARINLGRAFDLSSNRGTIPSPT
jgi:hypothetical protein